MIANMNPLVCFCSFCSLSFILNQALHWLATAGKCRRYRKGVTCFSLSKISCSAYVKESIRILLHTCTLYTKMMRFMIYRDFGKTKQDSYLVK